MWKQQWSPHRKMRTTFGLHVLFLLIQFTLGCATVPHDLPKTNTTHIADTDDTHFGGLAAEWASQHDDKSGFIPIGQGMDALGARLHLLEKADKSVDLQYFLMKDDTAGRVMLLALLKAADRGVRIRFLLDDVFTTAPDRNLLLINQHPNIEVRLFNPISRRGLRALNFAGNFRQANRRMHNKSFTADNAISIIGGRNIADEYFQLKETSVFADFDVLTLGPVVSEISSSFDDFWNHKLAIPIEQLSPDLAANALEEKRKQVGEEADAIYSGLYRGALESQFFKDIESGAQPLFAADARIMADSPEKLVNAVGIEHMALARDLRDVIKNATEEVMIISPYYVPRQGGVEFARELVNSNIRVVVITNSLASNNHVPVHSAYSRYRKDVVRVGVELFETRADAGHFTQNADGPEEFTLHTKLVFIDRRYLFVGSLNLDPRSIDINAEMGLLIDSKEMTSALADAVEALLPKLSYEIALNDKGKLEWHGVVDDIATVETKEPQTSAWLRFKAWFMKIAPESQM
jgi:putative cardiolipin synthase